ncbi:MAG: type 1 glutamine amidotransferase [Nitrospirae bacterium]|nr:type 1 glutamine amidotransferase [Nitrospirota bacterium]
MLEVIVLQHIECEDLGTIANAMSQRGIGCKYVRLFEGEPVPHDPGAFSGIIILGGPMNVYEEDKYPYLKDEDIFIKKAVMNDMPILGICLGAQLIAKAAGARVSKGTKKEIGWYKLSLSGDSRRDTLFKTLPEELKVFQWHGDTFEIPRGAIRLAGSGLFPNQAYRIGSRIYGIQFHLEVTKEMINQWISEYREELSRVDYINVSEIISDTPAYIETLNLSAGIFFEKFFEIMQT